MNILSIIKEGENKRVEFKKQLPSSQKIAKTIVAFSNTSGGKLIIGIDDELNIVGVDEDEIFELEEKVSSIIYDMCYPNILPEIYTINVDGRLLFVIEVFRGNLLPYYLKQKGKLEGTYIRIGSTNRQADESIIAELQRQRLNKTFDEEENFEFEMDKLNLDIIYDEFQDIDKDCDYEKLKNLRLIKSVHEKDIPTNALILTLGKFDNTLIKCAKFKGVTKDIFIDKKEFNDDLFSNLKNTMLFLQNHLNLSAKVEGLQLKEELEIPFVALREALLNAIIHRNYTRNSDIKVAIYDDMVEIVSPGNFPNGLTLEDVMSGRSELRNKIVANLFRKLKYIESWGSGIGKIKKLCQENDIKFELREEPNFISIIFYRKDNKKVSNSIEKVSNSIELNSNEKTIIEFLQKNRKIYSEDVEKLLDIKEAMARRVLQKLVKKELIEKIGKTKGSYYTLIENDTGTDI